jgi:hypothetical protein
MRSTMISSLGIALMLLVTAHVATGAPLEEPAAPAVGTAYVMVSDGADNEANVEVVALAGSDEDVHAMTGNQFVVARTNDEDAGNVHVRMVKMSSADVDENRGWLGVALGEIDTDTTDELDISEGSVRVINVVENSPAAEAGLLKDDVVTAINGEPISGVSDLAQQIGDLGPGAEVDFTVVREGAVLTLTTTLGKADRGTVKWIHQPRGNFDVRFFDQMKTGPQIIELSPMGKLRLLNEDDMKDLHSIPGIVADALSNMKVSVEVKIDDGERTLALSTVRDGTSISIEQAGDGPIVVTRSNEEGDEESTVEYADEAALEADDAEAYELYEQATLDGTHVYTTFDFDDADFDFDFGDWGTNEDLHAKIHERIEEAMRQVHGDDMTDKMLDDFMPHLQTLPE